jgi:hypothetical protein
MAMTAGGAVESRTRVKTQRVAENSAYVRKLLSQREPEFAAALTDAVRYISSCFGALDDQLHGRNVLGQQVEVDRRQHDGVASVDDQDRLINRRQVHEPLTARRGEELVRDQAALRRELPPPRWRPRRPTRSCGDSWLSLRPRDRAPAFGQ